MYIISDSKQPRSNQEHFPMVGCCPFLTFYFHVLLFWDKFSVCIAVGDDKKDDQVDDQMGDKKDDQVIDQIGGKVEVKGGKLEEGW